MCVLYVYNYTYVCHKTACNSRSQCLPLKTCCVARKSHGKKTILRAPCLVSSLGCFVASFGRNMFASFFGPRGMLCSLFLDMQRPSTHTYVTFSSKLLRQYCASVFPIHMPPSLRFYVRQFQFWVSILG